MGAKAMGKPSENQAKTGQKPRFCSGLGGPWVSRKNMENSCWERKEILQVVFR